ncbi:phage antirepressor KilAC domain-containing protein [Paraburkholderia aspalathi]|uniref:phage antirepressor KilAC domain-containing protein n=1 Tax=Paraburkholderia aspalathi TaxID=1324617 RepID=UPI001FD1D933|nr:phage antirepressor KilAC domain-containing protein [Paraburkholderia aspalathi]
MRLVDGANGEPWFIASDVCSALDIGNTSMALMPLDDDEKGVSSIDTPGGRQDVRTVSESGLYSLVMRSRKPEAKQFKRWITHDVLPSIRKTGAYGTVRVPQTLSGALRLAAEQAEQIEQQAAQLEAQKPAVEFVGRYVEADGSKGFREVCKLLSIKEPEFRAFLTDTNIVYRLAGRLVPYQQHIDAGRFEIKAGVTSDEHAYAFNQTRFTPKGIEWIAGKWMARRLNEKEITA